jgi:hypothetical protein
VAGETLRLLSTPVALETQRRAFAERAAELGAPGVGARAARHVLALLEGAMTGPGGPQGSAGEARARTPHT